MPSVPRKIGNAPAPVVSKTVNSPDVAEVEAPPARSSPASEFQSAAKKKPVNMTGRYKPVTRAPVPVKAELTSQVANLRIAAQAGAVRGSAKTLHTDGRLSAKAPYDKLPSRLKSKLNEKVWVALPEKQRNTLISTYARLEGWGVWDHVKTVKGELNPTEPHAHVGGKEFEVAGNSGGVVFETKDAKKFKQALIDTGHFGVDKGIVGSLHQGQDSTREWTEDPGSLHVSIGPGDQFDTHMDKYSPVKKPKDGETVIDAKKGPMHHSREVWPEMIRNVTGIPGVIVDVSVKPGSRDGKPDVTATVGIEIRGPVKSEKKKVERGPMPEGDAGPEGAVSDMLQHLDLSKVKFPRPKGIRPENMPDPKVMAEELAHRMLEAARTGKNPIELDLVDFAHQKGYQTPMLGELRRLGEQVRRELKASLERLPADQRGDLDLSKVTTLKVTFGMPNQGATVSLK